MGHSWRRPGTTRAATTKKKSSLRLTWIVCLLADTIALLRAKAMIMDPKNSDLLEPMRPEQMHFVLF